MSVEMERGRERFMDPRRELKSKEDKCGARTSRIL